MTESAFSHGPDPELGAALRRALDAGDDARFVARVRTALADVAARPRTWDVLDAWARRGLVAAAAAALVAGLLVTRAREQLAVAAELDEAFAAASTEAPALFASGAPPDPSVVLATLEQP